MKAAFFSKSWTIISGKPDLTKPIALYAQGVFTQPRPEADINV